MFYLLGLNLLQDEAQQTLVAIDHSCLAIIALTAGAELHFDNIKRVHKQASRRVLVKNVVQGYTTSFS